MMQAVTAVDKARLPFCLPLPASRRRSVQLSCLQKRESWQQTRERLTERLCTRDLAIWHNKAVHTEEPLLYHFE